MLTGMAPLWALTCLAFVSTNLDNLVVLTALRAAGGSRGVLSGYWAAVGLVLGAGLGFGVADNWLAPAYVGWLGCLPLGIGLYQLANLLLRRGPGASPALHGAGAAGGFAVFAAMSVDSVAVLGPLVADTADSLELCVLAIWAGMAALWTWLSGRLATRPALAAGAARLGPWLAPFLLVLVGCYILMETATDVVP